MKNLLAFLTLTIPVLGQANCPVPDLPDEFVLNERVISFSTTFDLEDDRGSFGKVAKKIVSLTKTFEYRDLNDRRIATAKQKILSWGTQIDVFDCQDNKIGSIKEHVLKSLLKLSTTYSILDPSEKLVAQSNKIDWLGCTDPLKTRQKLSNIPDILLMIIFFRG